MREETIILKIWFKNLKKKIKTLILHSTNIKSKVPQYLLNIEYWSPDDKYYDNFVYTKL